MKDLLKYYISVDGENFYGTLARDEFAAIAAFYADCTVGKNVPLNVYVQAEKDDADTVLTNGDGAVEFCYHVGTLVQLSF